MVRGHAEMRVAREHGVTRCLIRLELDVPVGSEFSLKALVQVDAACQPRVPSSLRAGGVSLLPPRPYVGD